MGHEAFFNAIAADWDTMAVYDDMKLQRIVTALVLERGHRVLDVGSGTGVMLPYLRRWIGVNGEVTAVDISANMLRQAQKKFGGLARFVEADVNELPFKNGAFDRVLCYSCFPHFADKYSALAEMRRVLTVNGSIIIAHSQGRVQINEFHQQMNNIVSNDLIPDDAQMVALAHQAKLTIEFVEHDASMYIVRLTKKENT